MHGIKESTCPSTADVLIVDDSANIRRLLGATLSPHYLTVEAEDGVTALAMIRKHRPRLVLLDVMMPGELNGLAALSAIREDIVICETLVVIVTARSQEVDLQNARRHGADGYLVKPFASTELLEAVRDLLAKAPQ